MHPLPLSLRLFAVAFWLGVVAVVFLLERSRAESRDQGFAGRPPPRPTALPG
ncbi:TPA: hypothetical protein NHQ65_005846 [Pseudomonas aeruginosa]|uniref:hypothetical protein n=1 Tax=Pseudomonas aeruginosa TaxID=287 RepID=UPI0004508304|nr:hypothetical protein [Pseudomonas aeruginosa]EZP22946.1 hypothetical protein V550_02792 [Pseudomonas aeruginosa BWH049]MBX5590073.1 hypothetical protein [Pseudomonas aeruginosa]MBY9108154.1 hypothetical protein [Pseudomonas aeruginosa]MBY9745445.1 hypothetical protein [Pseudomonas aeruginosa]MCA6864990.1 hypothetical protein [Pseudomonas aeruginosa]